MSAQLAQRRLVPYRAAFTLIELLSVVAIIAILAGILISVVGVVSENARKAKSTARLKNLGSSALLYSIEHAGSWPQSSHAYTQASPQWWLALAPYLGSDITRASDPRRADYLNGILRDPLDPEETPGGHSNEFSYGFNVYLQLGELDDYDGKPQRWNTVYRTPHPESTVIFATNQLDSSDHFMAHDWASTADAEHDLDIRSNDLAGFVFCDGHTEWLSPTQSFSPANGANLWHPDQAVQPKP
ncbi:type II secretion system protein [Cerasicoccus maritimus]|uniref:type II secretion system protein n=1 Tax=Cerasicoccus maritimus TaxID=490089 RepID=UPI0028526A18|nr:prepilin-type N-terminal cleavage/methylation domain-containing protein [Cerasicoccus maritimus]